MTGTRKMRALLVLAGILIVACATAGPFVPTADRLAAGGALPEGVDVETLRRGRAILLTRCSECHRTYGVESVPVSAWPGVARDMGQRASLRPDEVDDLIAYVEIASRARK